MSLFNRLGRRTKRRADGTRSSNCYFSKKFRTSRNFQQLQLFSIKSTNRRNYWDECHVEMVIRPGSSKCYFSIGSAAGRGDGTTGRRLFIVYWLHSVFLRYNFRTWQCIHNVSMIQKWILHIKLSTKVNFLVWKSASFATKISVY